MQQLRYYDHLRTARFVTFSCYRRYRYLSYAGAKHAVPAELVSLREGRGKVSHTA